MHNPAASDAKNATPIPPPLFRAARAGSAIGASTVMALIAGFLLQLSIAYKFGAGGSTDAYFMAQGTSELLAKILLGGSITSVFLPIFVEYLTGGQQERAWHLANNLFNVSALIFVFLLIVFEFFAGPIVAFIAPGFSPEIHNLTVLMLRIMLPAFFFTMLLELGSAMLNSLRIFGIPALARLIAPLLTFILVVSFADKAGVLILGIGYLAGGALQLALVLWALKRENVPYRFTMSFADPDLIRVLKLVSPFILSIFAAQFAGIVYRIMVSHFEPGSLSAIKFGDKISQMTNSLFLANIVVVSFPAFSRAVASKMESEIIKTAKQALRMMVYFGIPLTIGIILLRSNVIRVLYERGSFTPEDTEATSAVLGILLFGLLANSLSSLLGHLALALKVTKVSVTVTIITQIITSALFYLLAPQYGIKGLAMGSAISPFILTTLYAIALSKKLPHLWTIFTDLYFVKILFCGVALFAGAYAGRNFFSQFSHGLTNDIFTIIGTAISGVVLYLLSSYFLRVPELHAIKDVVYYAIKKKKS